MNTIRNDPDGEPNQQATREGARYSGALKLQQLASQPASTRDELQLIRAAVIATGLTEDEGSTLGMVQSICDLAVEQSKRP